MSRYTSRPAFSLRSPLVCVRALTLNGVTYAPGQPIDKTGVSERVLRNLHSQNRIAAADDAPRHPLDHDGVGRTGGSLPRAQHAQAAAAPAAPAADAPRYRIKQAGLGGFKVIDTSTGQPIGKGHKLKADAEAEIARLTAQ